MSFKTPRDLVQQVEKLSPLRLQSVVQDSVKFKDTSFTVRVTAAADLSSHEKESIWSIADRNMRPISSSSSMGWVEADKREELFDPMSRFILVYRAGSTQDSAPEKVSEAHNDIVAFTMFRFDQEYGESMVYCYELQISECVQRLGLGRFLMQQLINIGRQWRLENIKLTVLKVNSAALALYSRMGFVLDFTSPGYCTSDEEFDGEEYDYKILSLGLVDPGDKIDLEHEKLDDVSWELAP